MTEWIVSSSVLIAVVILLRQVLKGKISLGLQYGLWALVLVRLLIPGSLFDSRLSVMNATMVQSAVELEMEAEDFALPDLSIVEPDPELPLEEQKEQYEKNKAEWQAEMDAAKEAAGPLAANWDYLKMVWWLGIVAVGLTLLASNLRFYGRLRRSRRLVELEGCPRPVYVSGAVETPCLFGLVRPAVYITQSVLADEDALRHVWQHELTHYRHGDHLWSVLRCVCLALHWYNPLVWAAAYLSRRDSELACDEGTIRRIGEEERGDYGRTLIRLTCHSGEGKALFLTATTMTGGVKTIKERVTLIAKKPKMAVYTLVAVILIAALACACTFTGAKEEGADGEEILDYVRSLGVVDVDNMTEEQRQRLIDAGMDGVDEELQAMHDEFIEENQPVLVLSYLEDWRCEIDGVTYKLDWRSLIGTELDELQAYGETNGLGALGVYIQEKLDSGWDVLVEVGEPTVDITPAQPTSRSLTNEEIARVNEYFASMVENEWGGIEATAVSCFFTSWYDRPEDVDLNDFLRYFPSPAGGEPVGEDEFAALVSHENWPFSREITMDDMPVPIHRIPAGDVEAALRRYANIGLKDLSGVGFEYVCYLEEYDAFYTFTSDFGPGMFQCVRGEVEGDVIRLYSEVAAHAETYYMPSEVEVKLQNRDGAYYIVSHRIVTDKTT